jgi:integrase
VLLVFRHGLRAVELVGLRWEAVDLERGELHVHRAKGGSPGIHPLGGEEIRALRSPESGGVGR